MAPYRQLIEDAAIPEDVRAPMTLAASRYCHMVGGRMSDAVRSEISDFQRWGHDRYLETVAAASTAARELGY